MAMADAQRTVVLVVLAKDARHFADSIFAVTRARRRSRRVPQEWRVTLDEPGVTAGALTFTRRDGEAGTTWSLFAADKDFEEVRTTAEAGDVTAVAGALRRQALALLPPPAAKPRRPRQRPVPGSTIRRN